VWSPQEAYAHFAVPTPREQYAAMLAARATGHGPAPYDQHHHDPIVDFPG
jgi:hypothetical protein